MDRPEQRRILEAKLRAITEAAEQHVANHPDGQVCDWESSPCEECRPWAERGRRNVAQLPGYFRTMMWLGVKVVQALYTIQRLLRRILR
jgi:hypothetical protein